MKTEVKFFLMIFIAFFVSQGKALSEEKLLQGRVYTYDSRGNEVYLSGVDIIVSEPVDIDSSFTSTRTGKVKLWLPSDVDSGDKVKIDVFNKKNGLTKWRLLFPYKGKVVFSSNKKINQVKIVVVSSDSHRLKSEDEMMLILKDIIAQEALQLFDSGGKFVGWNRLIWEAAKKRNLPARQLEDDVKHWTEDVLNDPGNFDPGFYKFAKHSNNNFEKSDFSKEVQDGNYGLSDDFENFLELGIQSRYADDYISAINNFNEARNALKNSKACNDAFSEDGRPKINNHYIIEKYRRIVINCDKWIELQEQFAVTYLKLSKLSADRKLEYLAESVRRYEIIVYNNKILAR